MTDSLTSEDVRRHNIGLVLTHLLTEPASRIAIARATGLTPGAVTSLSAELRAAGLIREAAVLPSIGRGRPRTLLELSATHAATITLLLDADHVTSVVTTLTGETIARHTLRHGRPRGNPSPVVAALATVLDAALDDAEAAGRTAQELTLVAWAPVGGEPAHILASTDLDWGPTDIIGLLQATLPRIRDRQISLHGDTEMSAIEEHAAAGFPDSMLFLKADVGMGGALIIAGAPVVGDSHPAAVLGHLPVVHDGAMCECGQRGCLATVAGPDAIISACGLDAIATGSGIDAALVAFRTNLAAGEPLAVAAWTIARAHLARTLQILSLSFGPSVIVLGGYLSSLSDDVGLAFLDLQPTIAPPLPTAILPSRWSAEGALRGAEREARGRLVSRLLG